MPVFQSLKVSLRHLHVDPVQLPIVRNTLGRSGAKSNPTASEFGWTSHHLHVRIHIHIHFGVGPHDILRALPIPTIL